MLTLLEDTLRDPPQQTITRLGTDGIISVSNAVAAIAMYHSSKRLEQLTKVLVILTIVLAILTATLLLRTFLK